MGRIEICKIEKMGNGTIENGSMENGNMKI